MKIAQPSNNFYFVNVAKTIGIFLMALAHLPVPDGLYAFINSFHMPLFFLLSGYLLSIEGLPFKTFVAKKIKTLLVPYYVFALITFLFWFFIGQKFGNNTLYEQDTTKNILGAFFAIPSKEFMGFNLPIWFLPSLFSSEIIFYFVQNFSKKYSFIVFILIFGIGIVFHKVSPFRLPYGIDVSFFAVIFIYMGNWIREKDLINKYFIQRSSYILKFISLVVFAFITIYISHSNGKVSMYEGKLSNYILFFLGSFSGIVSLLCLSTMIPKIHLFNFYGRNTIIILGFHLMTFSIIKAIQVFIFKIPLEVSSDYWTVNILYVVLAFLILAPVIYLINKYFPFFLGRKNGII